MEPSNEALHSEERADVHGKALTSFLEMLDYEHKLWNATSDEVMGKLVMVSFALYMEAARLHIKRGDPIARVVRELRKMMLDPTL